MVDDGRTDDGRTTDGRTTDGRTTEHGYTISSPCEPDGSDELKIQRSDQQATVLPLSENSSIAFNITKICPCKYTDFS